VGRSKGLDPALREVLDGLRCRSRNGPRKRASPTRKCAKRIERRADGVDGSQGRQVDARRHALCREIDFAADAGSPVARAIWWMLEHLRQVIGLRGYGQRDPLNEYKAEAFSLFEAMIANLREAVTSQLMRVEIVQQPPAEEASQLPYMEAQKLDPATGENEMALAPTLASAGDVAVARNPKTRRPGANLPWQVLVLLAEPHEFFVATTLPRSSGPLDCARTATSPALARRRRQRHLVLTGGRIELLRFHVRKLGCSSAGAAARFRHASTGWSPPRADWRSWLRNRLKASALYSLSGSRWP